MNRRQTFAALAAVAMFAGTAPAYAETQYLTMDSLPPGTAAGQVGVAFSLVVQKALPVEIQTSVGKPATKSAIDLALGKVDLAGTAPIIHFLMQKQMAMYAKVDEAPAMASKLRGIVNYPLGPYHIIVYEDSGIKSLEDLKGKKVFLGPPGGAATSTMTGFIAAATGLNAGEDFESMRFDWKSAETAFLDRQMDVTIIPSNIPSPSAQQFSQAAPIRILGVSEAMMENEGIKKMLATPGNTAEVIPVGAYDKLANEVPVTTLGTWAGLTTHVGLDDDLVYDMTKAFWDGIADVHATAVWMDIITHDMAFNQMNIPLHAGAYRYYSEAGVEVPEALIPPEAK